MRWMATPIFIIRYCHRGDTVFAILGMLIPLLVSFVLAALLCLGKPKTRLEWIFTAWFTWAFSGYYFMTGGWFLLAYSLRYVVAGLVLEASVISFLRIPKGASFANLSQPREKYKLATYLVPSVIFTVLCIVAFCGRFYSGQAVALAFPLKGASYYIAQGGENVLVNTHHPYGAQIYSLDIVRLNSYGARAEGINQTSLEQYASFGTPVYSLCNGVVSTALDGLEDIAPGAAADTEHAAGNHVIISCNARDIQVLLAHMQRNSLRMPTSTAVKIGDQIGQIGNSGNTTEPHLHIHASIGGTPDKFTSGLGLPILFQRVFLERNDVVTI
jgi:Peptidase family M23